MTGISEARLANALFEGLTRLDPATLEPVPAAAEEVSVSPDGLVWTFRLRPDLTWSDGAPLTAEDFRWSWLRVLSPATAAPYASLLFPVAGAPEHHRNEVGEDAVGLRATDPRTLVVTLSRPVPYFPAIAAYAALFPVPRHVVTRHGARWTRPAHFAGNGPFVLEDHAFYRHLTLARNPRFRAGARARAGRIRLYPVSDPNTQFNLYATGAVDVVFSVPSTILHRLATRPDYRSGPRLATAFLRLNVTRPALADARVRRAVSLAIDRQTIAGRILRGGERPAASLVPPVLPGYRPPEAGLFDAAAAAALLAEAGHPGGRHLPALSLLYPENPEYAAIATVLQHDLEQRLGLTVRLDPREFKVSLAAQRGLDYDLALGQWIGDYPDPSTFLSCFTADSGNNRTGWKDPAFDEGLRRAETPLPGETAAEFSARRLRDYSESEALLLREAPIVPLWHPTSRFLVSSRVGGFAPSVMGLVSFASLSAGDR